MRFPKGDGEHGLGSHGRFRLRAERWSGSELLLCARGDRRHRELAGYERWGSYRTKRAYLWLPFMSDEPRSPWQSFLAFLDSAADWVRRHEAEIRAVGVWAAVGRAGRKARLYVPFHAEAWQQIEEAQRESGPEAEPDYAALIVSLYGPGGVAHDALRDELRSAELLRDRVREVDEVLESLADGRYFVTICGALPLVEYVLSRAAGKWNDPRKHLKELEARLDQPASDVQLDVLLEATAVEMVLDEVPEIWKDGRQNIGAINDRLNRHLALHGTARGWDDVANATRAILLLAAVARVAGPLLRPPTDP